jgi:hypothetical protein
MVKGSKSPEMKQDYHPPLFENYGGTGESAKSRKHEKYD